METTIRILRYLEGTIGRVIFLRCNNHLELCVYTDLDWAGNKDNRKLNFGFYTLVGGNIVIWKTKKQKVVDLSNAEAEF